MEIVDLEENIGDSDFKNGQKSENIEDFEIGNATLKQLKIQLSQVNHQLKNLKGA